MRWFKLFLSFLLVLINSLFISCLDYSNAIGTKKIISEDEAKEIVAKDIAESGYYQEYYVLSSPKFDPRVRDISWGKTVLVSIIPDGKLKKEADKYYLLSGVLPSGQVLVMKTVNAYTGQLLDGALLVDDNADSLIMATQEDCIEYARNMGYEAEVVEPIFYYDGSLFTLDQIYSWRYCVNIKNTRSIYSRAAKVDDFIFLDPWINYGNGKSKKMEKDNAFSSKVNFNHRAYKLDGVNMNQNYRSLATVDGCGKFIPID